MLNKRSKFIMLLPLEKYKITQLLLYKYEIVQQLFQPSCRKLALYYH